MSESLEPASNTSTQAQSAYISHSTNDGDLTRDETNSLTSTEQARSHHARPKSPPPIRRKPVPSASAQPPAEPTTSNRSKGSKKAGAFSKWWFATLALLDDWWFWEIFGLIGSALILVAIVILLAKFDGKRQPSWKEVSLNTVIAFLSTIAKLLAFVPLSAGIGQLKWIWIEKRDRSLADLEVFNSASTGVIGSICLLWITRGRHIVSLGAIATVLAIAFDPFNQALLHFYSDNVQDSSHVALLANASYFDSYGPLVGGSVTQVDPVLKANVYNSIFNSDAYQAWGIPQYLCSSGNCTWDPIASIEARSLCSDITSQMRRTCHWSTDYEAELCNQTIPDGASAWYIIGSPRNWAAQAMALQQPKKPLVYTNSSTSDLSARAPTIFIVQSIRALGLDPSKGGSMTQDISNTTKWVATECSLELQIRSVNVSVQNSNYYEETLATWSKIVYDQDRVVQGAPEGLYFSFVVPKDPSLGIHNPGDFYIGYNGHSSLQLSLLDNLNGTVFGFGDNLDFGDAGTVASDVLQTLFVSNFTTCVDSTRDKMSCLMSNIAAAISKTFRDSALTAAKARGYNATTASSVPNTANMAVGRTSVSATFVRVRWQWLSLPVLVWFLVLATWIGAAITTRRTKVQKWRNNVLPLLFLYRDENASSGMIQEHKPLPVDAETSFSARAQRIHARLVVQGNDSKLVRLS